MTEVITESILPAMSTGLGAAIIPAGAMRYIIYKELIPESHGDGNERNATYSFIVGLLFMIFLMETFNQGN